MAKLTVPRKSIAEGAASVVLREMKIDGLRVDPIAIATDKGILVKSKPDSVDGVSGMLVKVWSSSTWGACRKYMSVS